MRSGGAEMSKRMKVSILLLVLSAALVAGTVSGMFLVTGADQIYSDLILVHQPYPHQIEQIQTVFSGSNYELGGISPGVYILHIIPHSVHYLPEFYEGASTPAEAVELVITGNNSELTGIDITLEYQTNGTGCEVSGEVLLANGEPAAGNGVYLYGVYNNYWNTYETETDTGGEFCFSEVAAGSYVLFLEHVPGYQHCFWENGHNMQEADIIFLAPGEELEGLTLQLFPIPMQSISGRVSEFDGGEQFPLSGAFVSGYALNCWGEGEYFQAIADNYGNYSATVSGGMYWVYAMKSGYTEQYWQDASSFSEAVPLQINQALEDIDFLLTSISDPVDNSISGQISSNGEEPGVPCLVIVVASDEDDDWSETALSESSGYYYIDEIPEGDYYVVVMTGNTPPVYYPEGYDWELAEIVHIEGNVTGIDFEIEDMIQDGVIYVEGNITDENRQPVAGASVIFFNAEGLPVSYGVSDGDGIYRAASLTTGMYSVLAGKAFYESANTGISLYEDSELNFVINQSILETGEEDALPELNRELYCYPNPYLVSEIRSEVSIKLYPQQSGASRVSIYNLRGQLVENIFSGWLESEEKYITWAANSGGKDRASGIYLLTLEQSGRVRSAQKLLWIK
jgi:hypothetical protein